MWGVSTSEPVMVHDVATSPVRRQRPSVSLASGCHEERRQVDGGSVSVAIPFSTRQQAHVDG